MALPLAAVHARSNGEKFPRPLAVEESKNSQNMALLEAPRNSNPISLGGVEVVIVDGVALVPEGGENGTFVDASKTGGQINVYIVRQDDTLSEIAAMFDVSVNTIVWANDIRNSRIKPGQELVILPISGVRHVVRQGDTLRSIATRYKSELEDILAYNDLEAGAKINIGDEVIVPNGQIAQVASSATRTVSSASNTVAGYYIRPINGGRRSQGLHPFNAVDLAAPTGTPIMASASGRVIVARTSGYNGGYGLYVVISHPNGSQTLYAHMSRVNVSVGQQVRQGQVIGAVGSTGRSTGPHIHFEIRGGPRNPF